MLSPQADATKATMSQSVPQVVGLQPSSSTASSPTTSAAKDNHSESISMIGATPSSTASQLLGTTTRAVVSVEVRGSMLREWTLSTNRFTDDYSPSSLEGLNLHYQTIQPLAQSQELHLELQKVESDLSQSFKSDTFVVGSTLAVTSGLSVGYVIWMIRGGLIMTSLLAQVPAWQDIDPLTVLDSRGQREEDGESLQSLVDGAEDDDELTIT